MRLTTIHNDSKMKLKEYLENELLNSDTSIKWPEDYTKAFTGGKECSLLLYNFLEKKHLVKNGSFTCKPDGLKTAITFTIFSEAYNCYFSALHLAWNGYITASTILVRRIYELLVDLLFMLHKHNRKRTERFVTYCYIVRYIRLCHLYPGLNKRQLMKEIKSKWGANLTEMYLRYKNKFGIKENKILQDGKISHTYQLLGDWTYNLNQNNRSVSIKQRAEEVGLGDLHYKLSYNIFSAKTHVDSWDIGSKVRIADAFIQNVVFPIMPRKEENFMPSLMCGTQYITALFIVLAKIFNFCALSKEDDSLLKNCKKIKEHDDFKTCFKKVKIQSKSDF